MNTLRVLLRGGLTLGLLAGCSGFAWAAEPPKSAVTHPYPLGDKGDLWLLAGQSNMDGHGTIKEEWKADPRILFFASKEDQWVVATEPFHKLFFPSGDPHGFVPDYMASTAGGTSPGQYFAQRLIRYTGRPIGIIGVGTGRDMTRVWNPDLMGKNTPFFNAYEAMVKRIIQAGGWGRLKGVVWYQGESDAMEYPSASKVYEQSLTKFIDRLRADTGNPDLPFIIVQIDRNVSTRTLGEPGKSGGGEQLADAQGTFTETWQHVREVQRQMAHKRKNVHVVSTSDLCDMVDPIHLGDESIRKVGYRAAETALSEICKMPGHATPIKLESVTAEPLHVWKSDQIVKGRVVIRVRFSGVNGRLRSGDWPTGFHLHFEKAPNAVWAPYQTEFDPQDPKAVLLRYCGPLSDRLEPVLFYGDGLNPYCNIVDEKDMAIPAFGPLPVPPMKATEPAGK